jgi:hypothetical protein
MSKTVDMLVTTVAKDFPLGTTEGKFLFELIDAAGTVISFVETDSIGATFPLVPEANGYVARVTKNGVVATTAFDIPATSATFQVPGTVAVTISA